MKEQISGLNIALIPSARSFTRSFTAVVLLLLSLLGAGASQASPLKSTLEHMKHQYFMMPNLTITSGISRTELDSLLRRAGATPLICKASMQGLLDCKSKVVEDGHTTTAFLFRFIGGKLSEDTQILPVRLGVRAQMWMKQIYGEPTKYMPEQLDPSGNNDEFLWSLDEGCNPAQQGRRGLCGTVNIYGVNEETNMHGIELKWHDYNYER